MPLNEKVFDDQIRFVIKSDLKQALYREAARRHMSAADLLRLYIEEGLARGFVKTEGGRSTSKLAQKSVAILQKRRRHAGPRGRA
jgi:hypothetical protein